MKKNDNIGVFAVVVFGLAIALAGCDHESTSGSSASSRDAAQRGLQQKEEMIRRVNGIIEDIGSAETHLKEAEATIRAEKKALDEVEANAKTAHLGGQMSDFRMWQRIGQEKMTNIDKVIKKAENTIVSARRGAESELRRVNWVSSGEADTHVNQVNQRLSQLASWTARFGRISEDLAKHDSWLGANE